MSLFPRGRVLACVALFTLASACAATPAPYRVRYADVASGAVAGYDGKRALVIELSAGERVPVNFQFDSEDFELAPAHPNLELVAKRHCFVRLWTDGVRTSLDGEHFDEEPRIPGRFRVGLGAERGQAARLDVVIVTPRR